MAGLALEQRVASAVRARLEEANGTLEELVERALQAELDRLVRKLVDAELDLRATGSEETPRSVVVTDPEEPRMTKVCSRCGEEKPADQFEHGRRQCRQCRARAHAEWDRRRREAAEAPGADPFASGGGSTSTGSTGRRSSSAASSPV